MDKLLPYNQLLSAYGSHNLIPYSELLKTIEWHRKRLDIIKRDECKCTICNISETIYLANTPPFNFWIEGEDDIEVIEDEDGFVTGIHRTMVRVPAPKAVYLHVHHTYYAFDRKPWDYPDDALITLCSSCHFELHKNTKIQWVDLDNEFKYLTPCPRCYGAGHFPEYSHVQGGRCFYCKGAMYIELMK